jgi:AraC-like DNA-binding protein
MKKQLVKSVDSLGGQPPGQPALREIIARWTEGGEGETTAVPGLSLFRHEAPTDPVGGLYEPSVCVVAQGAKRVLLGEDTYVYDSQHYLITSVHLPTVFQVIEASPERPYLGLRLMLDLREVSQLMVDSNLPVSREQQMNRGMATGEMDQELLDAFRRLVTLLDHERDIPILAPVIQREIIYRLLVGPQGGRLRQIATTGSHGHQLAQAIRWMKDHYAERLRIEELAERTGMSTSTFHHHFRSMTALSPLRYQKKLRLEEARRLMLVENLDAANAAFEVGYESPSQFSREYKRLYGAPPLQDVETLRQQVSG